jgi:uncharacterized membrane protein HdeD (DUF308 family)
VRILRVLGGVALVGAALWSDATQANRWLSTFVIVGGAGLVFAGPALLSSALPGSPDSVRVRYVYRVALGVLVALAAAWFLFDDQLATSAMTTWLAIALLTYQAPWLPRRTREPQPTS